MLFVCIGVAFALIWFAPGTGAGKFLRKILVEAPAHRLGRITAGQVVCAAVLLLGVTLAVALAHTDGLVVFAQGTAETAAWVATFDIAAYLDAVALLWLLTATVRIREALSLASAAIARRVRSIVRRARGLAHSASRSRRPASKPSKPSTDDDGGRIAGWVAAF